MKTYRSVVYMILDQIKGISDDFTYTEDHVIYLIGKYRAYILKQKYTDIKRVIPESNYQTICLNLEKTTTKSDMCNDGPYVKSVKTIPNVMQVGVPKVYGTDYFSGENIAYISRERMRFVGYNKYLQNIIYCALGPDQYLYFKSSNPQFLNLETAKFTAIFEDAEKAAELQCADADGNKICDILDTDFPLEEGLIPVVIDLCMKELLGAAYRPNDNANNAHDNLEGVAVQDTTNQDLNNDQRNRPN